jgi:hypothetical protein
MTSQEELKKLLNEYLQNGGTLYSMAKSLNTRHNIIKDYWLGKSNPRIDTLDKIREIVTASKKR